MKPITHPVFEKGGGLHFSYLGVPCPFADFAIYCFVSPFQCLTTAIEITSCPGMGNSAEMRGSCTSCSLKTFGRLPSSFDRG